MPEAPLPKVLVVDDDAMNVEVLTSMLLNQGYYSNSSLGAREGLALIEERIELIKTGVKGAKMYELILLDYSMPGMDGP